MSPAFRCALLISLLLLLAGCGSNGSGVKFCPGANTGDCNCGTAGNAPCPILPQLLYATGTNGQVTVFPIAGTGALGSSTSTAGPSATLGMAALNNQFLYVSNPNLNIGGTSSINAWTINASSGVLTPVAGSPFSLGPLSLATGLATDSAAQVLYVADAGHIGALKADSNGALTAVSGSPFPAGTSLYLTVDPQNRFLFASDDTPPGNVLAFTINGSGALTAVPGSPFPTTTNTTGNTTPGQIVVDASGSFVYVSLTATGQVAAFSITASSGALTPVTGSPFAAGSQPLALAAFSNFLYVSNAGDGTLSGYRINSTTGALSPLSGSPFAIRGAALTVDPLGPFLYTSGASAIFAFTINPQTGALAPLPGTPSPAPPATVLTFVQ